MSTAYRRVIRALRKKRDEMGTIERLKILNREAKEHGGPGMNLVQMHQVELEKLLAVVEAGDALADATDEISKVFHGLARVELEKVLARYRNAKAEL